MTSPAPRPESAPTVEPDDRTGAMTRRAVVVGGALASVGLVAACSSGGSAAGGTTSAAATSAGPSTPAPSSPSATSGTGGTVLTPAASVPVGGGVIVSAGDQKIVVTQPSAGVFEGFSAVCPHEGCNCNEVVDQQIVCPCHNSKFAITDGAVQQGPARSGLAPVEVAMQGSDVVLA